MGNVTGRPLELFEVSGRPSGQTIGKLGDEAISEFIIDVWGERYFYAGLAPRTWSGEINVGALKSDEFVLPPGLVYRRLEPVPEGNMSGWVARFLASLFATRGHTNHEKR